MTTQNCPGCARAHDVSGLADGHEVSCPCGVQFPVRQVSASLGEGAVGSGITELNTYVGTALELPGYELVRVLGRGGMGEVWLARQISLGRSVAVKVLPPRLAKDPEFVTRFEKEATALAALSHPNIIQIIDRGVAGEHYYFVMEYVEGRSLREVMRELSPPEALRLALQVARAIECAHDKGIIHRDLKPENILLDGRGHVKVADFGLAGIRQPDSRLQLTATSVAMGTLNYMAPEQRRDAKNVDGRADLFSFGVVLYELLTGELPVGRFKLPSERVPGLDARLDAVVARLLENAPEARYARAAEVCQALEGLVTSVSQPGLSSGRVTEPQALVREGGVRGRLKSGWSKVRTGLSVMGGVMVISFSLRMLLGPVGVQVSEDKKVVVGTWGPRLVPADKRWPANTNGDLFATSAVEELSDGRVRLDMDFVAGGEELNAHAGTWSVSGGRLTAEQGGNDTTGGEGKLIPRAYLANRYFSTDDFSAEVLMGVRPLGRGYSEEPDAQHYGELAFRITGLQVSVFAIPGAGMRMSWRYTTEDEKEVVGNSAQDVESLVEDETPVPMEGPFRVKLQLKKKKTGLEVEAFLNGQRFARKYLEGLQGRAGKVAMGCRNLVCTFEDLTVRGVPMKKPQRTNKVAETQQD
ncbi:serine/threonine-protein kinase [Archangium sp.]|uniref:serine/threonine-protein kinase n=1 Tax=Archangium sp. TaxID=1872627 RepID=UPI002EDA5C8F